VSAEKPYVAKTGNGARDYPIVTLVNHYSASAAGIVAGALQDQRPRLDLGDNTFARFGADRFTRYRRTRAWRSPRPATTHPAGG